jgi:hypothetical protein
MKVVLLLCVYAWLDGRHEQVPLIDSRKDHHKSGFDRLVDVYNDSLDNASVLDRGIGSIHHERVVLVVWFYVSNWLYYRTRSILTGLKCKVYQIPVASADNVLDTSTTNSLPYSRSVSNRIRLSNDVTQPFKLKFRRQLRSTLEAGFINRRRKFCGRHSGCY